MKFVDIKNDVAFRKIFGNQNKTEALISFLNAVLILPDNKKIVEVTILTPYQLPELRGGKVTIVDVAANDQNGNTYIVEMQIAHVDGFHKRVLYYASKSYSSQINRGDDYKNLKPTFFIGILDFNATQSENYISRHIVKNSQTDEHFLTDIEFTFIELPKFHKKDTELHSIEDQWIYFLKNAENVQVIPSTIDDIGLKSAYEEADKHNWTQAELEAYDKIFMREQDDRGRLSFAVQNAVTEIEKNIAKNLIHMGLSDEEIEKATGLSSENIEKLKSDLN